MKSRRMDYDEISRKSVGCCQGSTFLRLPGSHMKLSREPAMGSDKRGGQQSASAELGHVMRRHAGSVDRKQFTYWSPAHEGLPLGGLRPGEDDNSRSGPFFGAAEVGWSAHDKGLLAGWRAHDRDLLAPLEVAHRGRSWPENEPWLFASRPSISAGQGDSPPRRTWQGLSHSEGKGYLERQRYVETAREVRWQDPMQEIRRWARELDHYRSNASVTWHASTSEDKFGRLRGFRGERWGEGEAPTWPGGQLAAEGAESGGLDVEEAAGLGLVVSYSTTGLGLVVEGTVPGLEAAESSLKPGDQIVEIDGFKIAGWPTGAVRLALMGRAGTHVRLGVAHPCALVGAVDMGLRQVVLARRHLRPKRASPATAAPGDHPTSVDAHLDWYGQLEPPDLAPRASFAAAGLGEGEWLRRSTQLDRLSRSGEVPRDEMEGRLNERGSDSEEEGDGSVLGEGRGRAAVATASARGDVVMVGHSPSCSAEADPAFWWEDGAAAGSALAEHGLFLPGERLVPGDVPHREGSGIADSGRAVSLLGGWGRAEGQLAREGEPGAAGQRAWGERRVLCEVACREAAWAEQLDEAGVSAQAEWGYPKRLPEGGYTFLSTLRLNARVVVVELREGATDVGACGAIAEAALRVGAAALVLVATADVTELDEDLERTLRGQGMSAAAMSEALPAHVGIPVAFVARAALGALEKCRAARIVLRTRPRSARLLSAEAGAGPSAREALQEPPRGSSALLAQQRGSGGALPPLPRDDTLGVNAAAGVSSPWI